MFRGSIVALVTPMLGNGDVDYDQLEALVEFKNQMLHRDRLFEALDNALFYFNSHQPTLNELLIIF